MVVFASKYNFGINISHKRPLLYTSPHLPNSRVHSRVFFFRRKFWTSKFMYRGSAGDFLVVLCKPGNLTTNATTERCLLYTFSQLSSALVACRRLSSSEGALAGNWEVFCAKTRSRWRCQAQERRTPTAVPILLLQ